MPDLRAAIAERIHAGSFLDPEACDIIAGSILVLPEMQARDRMVSAARARRRELIPKTSTGAYRTVIELVDAVAELDALEGQ